MTRLEQELGPHAPRWLEVLAEKRAHELGKAVPGRFVPIEEVCFGRYAHFLPATLKEAEVVEEWGGEVLYTSTNVERFFISPEFAKDVRVISELTGDKLKDWKNTRRSRWSY